MRAGTCQVEGYRPQGGIQVMPLAGLGLAQISKSSSSGGGAQVVIAPAGGGTVLK
jgi:hypothetical protein